MSVKDHLNAVRIFLHAARHENFSSAAEQLDVTGSAVAKAISKLEQQLQARLFHRTTRQVSLTEEGRLFFEGCVRAFSELDAAEALIMSRVHEPAGRLTMTVPELMGRRMVMPVVHALAERYPALRIDLSFTNQIVDLIADEVDLAVRVGSTYVGADMIIRRLGTQKLVICGSPDYIAAHGVPEHPDHLSSHHCITYIRGKIPEPWRIASAGGDAIHVRIKGQLNIGDYEAIVDACLDGFGLAQVPNWRVSDAVAEQRLIPVLESYALAGLPICAVWSHRRNLTPKVRVAVDALLQGFSQIP
jgi:DNA-binding transcriptional LysR family regulator